MSKKFILPSIIMLSVFSLDQVYSTTWYVHPDSILNSIQAGLDSCTTNDTVLVGPGTYYENIWWPIGILGINLVSEVGRDSTIINGQNQGRVILMSHHDVDKRGLINGFTIQNGYYNGLGGGIHCCADSFTISNNLIINNDADFGGGISNVSHKTLFIINNINQLGNLICKTI